MKPVSVYADQMERCNENKSRCECKELIDKGVCDKGFIWNPSNCECECNKSCDIGEQLDYENCKCRKKLVDKLTDECTESIEEIEITNITFTENENNYECVFRHSLYCIDDSSYCNFYWNYRLFSLLQLVFD